MSAQQVQLNTEEFKNFMKYMIVNNTVIQEKGEVPVTVNCIGEAGLGKTSCVKQLAEELNLDFIKINLSQLEELGDLIGFPVKEFEIENSEGKKMWINEHQIDAAMKKGYKVTNKRMSHAIPEWVHGKGEGGILLIDDFSRADMRFQQAVMELCDQQTYASWKLPKKWSIILTSNPDTGDYYVTSLDIAQKTRYITVELKFDSNVWGKWAEKKDLDSRTINFLLLHPELVTQSVNPRSIVNFFKSISSIEDFSKTLPLIQMIGEGSVGPEFATMFTMFINNKLDKIIAPKDIFEKDEQYVLNTLKSSIGTEDEFRADLSSVVATRIINYSLTYSEKNSINKSMIERIIKLTTDCDSFTDDLQYYIIKELINGNKVKFAPLMMNANVVKMSVK